MKKMTKLSSLGIMFVLSTGIAFGAPCVTLSSATFTTGDHVSTPGGVCNVAGNTFDLFEVVAAVGFGTPQAFELNVTAIPLGINISYTGLIGAQDIQLTYRVTPGLNLVNLASSSATITETVCDVIFDPTVTSCAGAGGNVLGTGSIAPGGFQTINLGPSNTGYNFVFKDIAGGSDAIQTFVPEPGSMALLGAGLMGLGFFARRRSLKK